MDFLSVVRVVLRRWPIVLGALVLSTLAAYMAARSVAPSYQAKGSALLVGPQGAAIPGAEELQLDNPYTRLDNSTLVLTAVAVQIMDDSAIRESLQDEGAAPDYVVGRAEDGTPVLGVVVTNTDPAVAVKTVDLVLDRLNAELDDRQAEAGAPPDSRVRSIVVTRSDTAIEQLGGRIRAFLAVAALGVAASISLAFITEAIVQGRRRRADEAAPPSPETTAPMPEAAPPTPKATPPSPEAVPSADGDGLSASAAAVLQAPPSAKSDSGG